MGIKEIFEAQQQEFISLRDLLEHMSKAEGVSLKMAAIVLHRLLTEAYDSAPPFVERRVSTLGPVTGSTKAALMQRIADVGQWGAFGQLGFEDMDDDIPF